MKERAKSIIEDIKTYLEKDNNELAIFYLNFISKNNVSDLLSNIFLYENSVSKIEYTCFLLNNRQHIKEITTIENRLIKDFEHDIKNNNLSFVEGAAGILHYLFLVNHPKCGSLTMQLAEKIKLTISCFNNINVYIGTKGFEIFLGFEGLAGILKVLSKSEESAVQLIVKNGILFFSKFMNTVIDFKKNEFAMFPHILRIEDNKVKPENSDCLSWSIGDLGIATTISQISTQINDKDLNRTAQLVGFNTLLRKEPKSTHITHPFFRNGAAGLAYTYGYLYKQTEIKLFHQSYEFWIEKTIDFTEELIKKGQFFNNLSILNGITGVAVTLESYVNNKEFCHDFLMAD